MFIRIVLNVFISLHKNCYCRLHVQYVMRCRLLICFFCLLYYLFSSVCMYVCVCRLQFTQGHCVTAPQELEAKPWVKGVGERGLEGVDVCQRAQRGSFPSGLRCDSVEGHGARAVVNVHTHSARGPGNSHVRPPVAVPGDVVIVVTFETPGPVLPSQVGPVALSFPPHPSVRHTHTGVSSHRDLPVTAVGQSLATQHLLEEEESLCVRRIGVLLPDKGNPPVVL